MIRKTENLKSFIRLLIIFTISLYGCSASEQSVKTEDLKGSLYDRLGGKEKIVALVEEFTDRVTSDNQIGSFFVNTELSVFKIHLADKICDITGGPCSYSGKDSHEIYTGLRITQEHFEAFLRNLKDAMDVLAISGREQDDLISLLRAMSSDIIGL